MKLVKLKNTTTVTQAIMHEHEDGTIRQHSLKAGEVKRLPSDVVKSFLKEVPDNVLIVAEEVNTAVEDEIPQEYGTIWLANVTGNPDAPDTVKAKRWNREKRRYVIEEVPNPLKPETVQSRMWSPAQKEVMTPSGPTLASYPAKRVSLVPFSRREVPKDLAKWILRRDRNAQPESVGRIIKSRKPSGFEPDETWSLEDARLYLKYCDPAAELGKTEKEVLAEFDDKNSYEAQQALEEARSLVLRRCFFRVVNPDVVLPTKKSFETFKKSQTLKPKTKQGRKKSTNNILDAAGLS